ncbi:MAG: sporulation membrane protein YtaF [Limnochordia bacterium]|nr:sporulation membrane protein YtaF [Limnochordia bacterium]
MTLISVIFLAVAVSFDSLAMGITYGMNHISIPFWSKVVLSIVSGCSVFVSMTIGWFLEQRINPNLATTIGGLVFILLGLYHLWRNYRPAQARILINVRIPLLGLIIQIFQEPLLADSDHSQTISGEEAFILGGALALDAIGAGFGAAMLGLPVWTTTLAVMVGSYFFVAQGLKTGAALASSSLPKGNLRWLPGTIVLCIGLVKIIVG